MKSVGAPEDLEWGAFSDEPPWVVDPDRLVWREGLDGLRVRATAGARALARRRAVPPGLATLHVAGVLGVALAGW